MRMRVRVRSWAREGGFLRRVLLLVEFEEVRRILAGALIENAATSINDTWSNSVEEWTSTRKHFDSHRSSLSLMSGAFKAS
jgi:hypothetical protein